MKITIFIKCILALTYLCNEKLNIKYNTLNIDLNLSIKKVTIDTCYLE